MDSENKILNGPTQNIIVQGLCWIQSVPTTRTVQQQPKEKKCTETVLRLLLLEEFS